MHSLCPLGKRVNQPFCLHELLLFSPPPSFEVRNYAQMLLCVFFPFFFFFRINSAKAAHSLVEVRCLLRIQGEGPWLDPLDVKSLIEGVLFSHRVLKCCPGGRDWLRDE